MKDLNGLKLLTKFPIENIWMLAVDGSFYVKENGPVGFDEREKGSVQGILDGLKTTLERLGKELTVADILAIHKSCMTGFKSRNPCVPGELRKNEVAMDVLPGWVSVAGLQHLIANKHPSASVLPVRFLSPDGKSIIPVEKVNINERKNYKCASIEKEQFTMQNTVNKDTLTNFFNKFTEQKLMLMYAPPVPKTSADQLFNITKSYNDRIKLASTNDDRLKIIADTIQQYTRQHPFRDGNNRTFVNCLLMRLLIENGLPPTLFFEPNIFEFHTIGELVDIIKKGQILFMSIINNPKATVYDFDNSKVKNIEDGKYIKMGHNFLNELNIMLNKMGKEYYRDKNYSLASEFFHMSYELEKRLTDEESPSTATTLYNLASALKELGQAQKSNSNDFTKLQEAKSHFNTVIGLFGKNQQSDSLVKAKQKLLDIEKLMTELSGNAPAIPKPI